MIHALEGIKVLDLCRSYPPAISSMLMADFGADVIKVDPIGSSTPSLTPSRGEEKASVYSFWDRNKRSIRLNLKSHEGREVFLKLAKQADVLVENSRPGTMQRIGIDYANLKKINPRIVYCSVSGYGQDGPYRDAVGHDSNYLGISGVISLIGPRDGPPVMPSNFIADVAGAGFHSFMGIMVALMARNKTGKGQYIDISYTDCVFAMAGFDLATYLITGKKMRRGRTWLTGAEPCAAVYQTKDNEYITLEVMEPAFWVKFCHAIERPDLIPNQWPRDDQAREEMFSLLRGIFLTKTKYEWWEWARENEIMLAPVLYIEESVDDPQLRHRKMIIEKEHPRLGKILQLGNPLKLSDTPPDPVKAYSPGPGEHTDMILTELNFSKRQIEALRKQGAIE